MRITSLTILVTLACCKSLPDHTITREDHLIPATGGIQLHIREISPFNQIQDVPLVMIHGGGPGTTASFDLPVAGGSFAQEFANEGYKIYLVNMRGWENSTLPDYDFSDSTIVVGSHLEASEDIRTALNWILDRNEIQKVHLFGWTTGGHWAGHYSTQYPESVSTFISLNSLYGANAPWDLRQYFQSDEDTTKFKKTSFFRESSQENLTRSWTRTIPIEKKEQWRDPNIEQAYRKYASGFGADTTVLKVPGGYREESFYMSLGKKYWDAKDMVVPALIIRTELDFWSRPEDLEMIKKDMKNSQRSKFITIPGTHYVFLDKPERGRQRLVEEMLDFMID